MCSRYELSADAAKLARRYGLIAPPPPAPKSELRPTDPGLAILPGPEARLLIFGLPVEWDAKPLINARAESLGKKAFFAPLLAHRILIPATAYFEWNKNLPGKPKMRLAPEPGLMPEGILSFAGLIAGDRFLIVTCAPAPAIAGVHDRMPVILAPEAERLWLDPARNFADVAPLLAPYQKTTATREAPPSRQGDLFDR